MMKGPKLCMVSSEGNTVDMITAVVKASVFRERAITIRDAVQNLLTFRDTSPEMGLFMRPGPVEESADVALEALMKNAYRMVEISEQVEATAIVMSNDVVAQVLKAEPCDCEQCQASRLSTMPKLVDLEEALTVAAGSGKDLGEVVREVVKAAAKAMEDEKKKGEPNA